MREAFDKFMQTKSGQAYVNQFLKKGESVRLLMADGEEQAYSFKGNGNGAYSNSRLRVAGYNLPSNVFGESRAYHADGETRLLKSKTETKRWQMGLLQNDKSFEMRIMLNGTLDRSASDWAETIGHEAFVHSTDDANVINKVMKALIDGVSEDDVRKLMGDLDQAGVSANEDHKRLNAGKDEDYNKYIKELENEENEY